MSEQLHQDIDCPHCKNTVGLNITKTKPKPEQKKTVDLEIPQIEQLSPPVEQSHSHEPEPIQFSHDDLSDLMPTGMNFAKCKDGKCGSMVKNSKITKNFKSCPNCESNTVPGKSKFCPTCGKTEPQDIEDLEDYWDESEINLDELSALDEDD